MPFKSLAQRRKFAQLLVEGKISAQAFEEWNRETGDRKLPERAAEAKNGVRKTKSSRTGTRQAEKARREEALNLSRIGRRSLSTSAPIVQDGDYSCMHILTSNVGAKRLDLVIKHEHIRE